MTSHIVSCLFPMENYIQMFLTAVQQKKIGVLWNESSFNISTMNFGKMKNYHLYFSIPYAKKTLTWEICFNSLLPELGPDIIFNEEEYSQSEFVQKSVRYLPSLIHWNYSDDMSLLNTLTDLIQLYKQYQVQLLTKYAEKLLLEYKLLLNVVKLDNIELDVFHKLQPIEVKFLVKLTVNLPIILTLQTKISDIDVLLFIHFLEPAKNARIVPELYLPTYLQIIFDKVESLRIPPLPENQHLADYITEITEYINDKVKVAVESIENRKKFIITLLVLQHAAVLEYDIVTYKTVSLLLKKSDFHLILSFTIPNNFPREPFSIALYSIYHMTDQGKPIHLNVENFPYCRRWNHKEMITKALSHIVENEIKNFQDLSRKYSRF